MTDDEIIAWHKRVFPDATLESQLLKLEEEVRELNNEVCVERKEKEIADVYIVSVVLDKRFDSELGRYFLNIIKNTNTSDKLKELVEYKMEINKGRHWVYKKGVYRHDRPTE